MLLPASSCHAKYRGKYMLDNNINAYFSECSKLEKTRQRRTPEKIYKEKNEIPDNPRNINLHSRSNDINNNIIPQSIDIMLDYKYVSKQTKFFKQCIAKLNNDNFIKK